MSRSRKRKLSRAQKNKVSPTETHLTSTTTEGGLASPGVPVNFNLQFNQLSLPGDCIGVMQVAATLPTSMQEKALLMAEKEQEHRHKMDLLANQQQFELLQKEQEDNYKLKLQKQSKTYASEMFGKVFGCMVLGGFLAAIIYMSIIGNYKGLALILGAAALLGILIRAFVWLMGQNRNA